MITAPILALEIHQGEHAMCIRIDLKKEPMEQGEIESKRKALKTGYILYGVLIALFLVSGLGSASMPAAAVMIPSIIALGMVAYSAKNNLVVLDPAKYDPILENAIAQADPDGEVRQYLRKVDQMNRPMVIAEARAITKSLMSLRQTEQAHASA
jgi:hypothetical protein